MQDLWLNPIGEASGVLRTNTCSYRVGGMPEHGHGYTDEERKLRYVVHFTDGGSGRRAYHVPLQEAGVLVDGDDEYIVTRVDQPRGIDGLGYAWVERL